MVQIDDPWFALQFDNAVTLVGNVIEGAFMETYNAGTDSKPQTERKYDMHQLLDPDFRLPAPLTKEEKDSQRQRAAIGAWRALAARGGKVIKIP